MHVMLQIIGKIVVILEFLLVKTRGSQNILKHYRKNENNIIVISVSKFSWRLLALMLKNLQKNTYPDVEI